MASSDQMSDGPPTKKAKMGGDAGKFAQFSFLKTPRKNIIVYVYGNLFQSYSVDCFLFVYTQFKIR